MRRTKGVALAAIGNGWWSGGLPYTTNSKHEKTAAQPWGGHQPQNADQGGFDPPEAVARPRRWP
eukprot:6223732-Pyramimonas_sp.AAC.1